jgi:hypothetical protein
MDVKEIFLHFLHDLLVVVSKVFQGLENFSTQLPYELLLGASLVYLTKNHFATHFTMMLHFQSNNFFT